MIKTVRLEIRGLVQGVGYRWSMQQQARRLALGGWVRNRADGSVEAVVAGAPDAVEQIVAWSWQGPSGAAVVAVEVSDADGAFDAFEQRPTA